MIVPGSFANSHHLSGLSLRLFHFQCKLMVHLHGSTTRTGAVVADIQLLHSLGNPRGSMKCILLWSNQYVGTLLELRKTSLVLILSNMIGQLSFSVPLKACLGRTLGIKAPPWLARSPILQEGISNLSSEWMRAFEMECRSSRRIDVSRCLPRLHAPSFQLNGTKRGPVMDQFHCCRWWLLEDSFHYIGLLKCWMEKICPGMAF